MNLSLIFSIRVKNELVRVMEVLGRSKRHHKWNDLGFQHKRYSQAVCAVPGLWILTSQSYLQHGMICNADWMLFVLCLIIANGPKTIVVTYWSLWGSLPLGIPVDGGMDITQFAVPLLLSFWLHLWSLHASVLRLQSLMRPCWQCHVCLGRGKMWD